MPFPTSILRDSEESLPRTTGTGGYDTYTLLSRMIQSSERTNVLLETILQNQIDLLEETSSTRRVMVELSATMRNMNITMGSDPRVSPTPNRDSESSSTGQGTTDGYARDQSTSRYAPRTPTPGRPIGRARTSLSSNAWSTSIAEDASVSYYFPSEKALNNKYSFMASVVIHVLNLVIQSGRGAEIDYFDSRNINTSILQEAIKTFATASLINVPNMVSIRKHLTYIGSTDRTITKDSVASDMFTVLQDMDTRSALNALVPLLVNVSVLFPISYRAALVAIHEPYVTKEGPSYSKTLFRQRPDGPFANVVSFMKIADVKSILKDYNPKSKSSAAFDAIVTAKCRTLGIDISP